MNESNSLNPPLREKKKPKDVVPDWNNDLRELTWQGQLVKCYRTRAGSQIPILVAFQKAGWVRRIVNPLPILTGNDASERLHNAIAGLNRKQKNRKIRFFRDGTTEGICWEYVRLHPKSNRSISSVHD